MSECSEARRPTLCALERSRCGAVPILKLADTPLRRRAHAALGRPVTCGDRARRRAGAWSVLEIPLQCSWRVVALARGASSKFSAEVTTFRGCSPRVVVVACSVLEILRGSDDAYSACKYDMSGKVVEISVFTITSEPANGSGYG